MPITRDEVAHLARLSRLALSDEELDHLAPQLDQIISSVAQVQEVAADRSAAVIVMSSSIWPALTPRPGSAAP